MAASSAVYSGARVTKGGCIGWPLLQPAVAPCSKATACATWVSPYSAGATLMSVSLRSDYRLFRRSDSKVLPLPIERFIDETNCDVQTDATPDQLDAMLSRIKTAWQSLGETEPHYSVLTNEAYRSNNFDRNRDKFYDSGLVDVKRALAFLSRNGIDPSSIHRVLDYGCGVGRLIVALTQHFPAVTGIDFSDAHLCHAKRHAS